MDNYQNHRAKIIESTIKPGTWKVWIQGPHAAGYLRQGFAWKTKTGAEAAAVKAYPGINFFS